jgi:hypothetical protein
MAVVAVVEAVGSYGAFVGAAYTAGAAAAGVVGGVIAAAGAAVVGLAVPGLFLGSSVGGALGAIIAGANIAMSAYSIGSTIAAGGDLGDVLRGVAVNFVSAAISSGFLSKFEPVAGQAFAGAKATASTVKHVAGHAILGGLSQEALGGRFQDGFLSAAASTFLMDMGISRKLGLGDPGDMKNPAKFLGRTAVAGIIGGTVSAIGGGKFANGAYTSAFQHLTNAEGGAHARNKAITSASEEGTVVEVHIWDSDGKGEDKLYGHASMTIDPGGENETHISLWPQASTEATPRVPYLLTRIPLLNLLPGIQSLYSVEPVYGQDFSADMSGEHGRKPVTYRITGLDTDRMRSWWDGYLSETRWSSLTNNCATCVYKGLRAGGAPYALPRVWSPNGVGKYAAGLQ